MTENIVLGIGGFVLNILILTAVVTWRLAGAKAEIMAAITDHQKDVDAEFARLRREIGETISAIRQKVHEVEIWARDELRQQMTKDIKELGEELRGRLERMEHKIDSKT